jgi:hypothetical protein
MKEMPGQADAASPDTAGCSFVRRLVQQWSENRDRPFPYLEIGDHLTHCLSCLVWSTGIAHQPADEYLSALSLRLSDLLTYLGESLLAVISGAQETRIRFAYQPEELTAARGMALQFLGRYESFSDAAKADAERIRGMVAHADSGSPLVALEPYELVRYFFQTALALSTAGDKNLSVLVYLGITENYQAMSERRAGHDAAAGDHFNEARACFRRVLAVDPRQYKGTASGTAEFDKSALATARVNLAGTEVQQDSYSKAALSRSVELLEEARRLVFELGLPPVDNTAIFSNLLISYLRLYLDHSDPAAYEEAGRLAREIVAAPDLARAFLAECVRQQADPELAELLAKPEAKELADYLNQQTSAILP